MIRAVVCDFGGVLTSPLADSFRAFSEHSGIPLAALGAALAEIAERDGVNPLHELECGRVGERAFLADLAAVMGSTLHRDVAMDDFTERYFAGLRPNEPMIALMAQLRDEGYRMALLTNNVREWQARWRALAPIDELFEVVVDSSFAGMRKPEPAIYELTTQRLGLPAGECLFIDDIEENCIAAHAAGMRAVVFADAEQAITEIRAALAGDQLSQPSRSQR